MALLTLDISSIRERDANSTWIADIFTQQLQEDRRALLARLDEAEGERDEAKRLLRAGVELVGDANPVLATEIEEFLDRDA